MTTISQWLKNSSLKLKKISNSPYIDAELILSLTLKMTKEKLISENNRLLKPMEIKIAEKLLKQRLIGTPISYITNHKFFYGYNFFVNNKVLIPRPDSESIIDISLKLLESYRCPKVVEIGVGSGAIIISLVKKLNKKIDAYGLDVSSSALTVAKKNLINHGLEKTITLKKSNLLKNWDKKKKIDLIIANLPYLPNNYLKKHNTTSELSLKFEPKISLFSGKDGLDLYKQFYQELADFKFDYLIIEVLPQQIKATCNIFNKRYKTVAQKDLGGHLRFVLISNK